MDLRRQIAEKERIVEILEREGCQLSVNQDRGVLEDCNGVAVARAKGDLSWSPDPVLHDQSSLDPRLSLLWYSRPCSGRGFCNEPGEACAPQAKGGQGTIIIIIIIIYFTHYAFTYSIIKFVVIVKYME